MEIPSPRSSKRARIEIIPLIDIIFFLLATFVLVSMSMIKNQGIPVRLPGATSSSPQERSNSTAISVAETGQVYLDKEEITLEQLPARLKALKADQGDELRIFINGDENARLGLAISVLDETRKAGITKVAFETKGKPKP